MGKQATKERRYYASAAQLMFGWRQEGKVGTEAEGKREVEVVVGLVEAVEVVVEDTKTKE